MSKTKLIIFGNGIIAQLANYYFSTDSSFEVVAFTVDKAYCKDVYFEDKPLVPFDQVEQLYPASNYQAFVALSYTQMNKLRTQKLKEVKAKGYAIASYISSKCNYLSNNKPGENAFILEDNTIQPFVSIGNNVTLWSGNHIGHHTDIADNNFISSHVVISGNCIVKSFCFFGVNSTIVHNVTIAEGTLIGAGAIIAKNTEKHGVYVAPKTIKLDSTSNMINL